ncbi:hypothetical protein D5S17_07510 [Pseudonocardiaceae bacterium YIM PH 21723]|nr:hypothetical protein D5S17_07510 [Pseudonocardiaceae bacterium YIM PH 21723]
MDIVWQRQTPEAVQPTSLNPGEYSVASAMEQGSGQELLGQRWMFTQLHNSGKQFPPRPLRLTTPGNGSLGNTELAKSYRGDDAMPAQPL